MYVILFRIHLFSCSSELVIEVMFVRQLTNAGMLHYQIYG